MSNRYSDYRSSRSPIRDPTRSSLQEFGSYSSHSQGRGFHAVPTRKEFGTAPRNSERGLLTPVVTTTYKITPDVPRFSNTSAHRHSSRERRSTVDNGRPASIHVITASPRHRPNSPLHDPYRTSSDGYRDRGYDMPANSTKHRHSYAPHHSATIDNSDMNQGLRAPTIGLSRKNSGHRASFSHRDSYGSASRSVPLVRHPDTMADDYGHNGYGYTNPRDVVQYDLSRGQSQYYDSRSNDRPRPIVVASPAEIINVKPYDTKSYDYVGRPPPATRGLDHLSRNSIYDSHSTTRNKSRDPPYRSDPCYDNRHQRSEASRQESEYLTLRDTSRAREGPQTYRDIREDGYVRKRDIPRTDRPILQYEDDCGADRDDRRDYRDSFDKKDNFRSRDERKTRSDDSEDKYREKRGEKKSSNRDTLASLAGLAGAAFGIKGLAEVFGGGDDEGGIERSRSGDEREQKQQRHKDGYKYRGNDDDDPAATTSLKGGRTDDDSDSRNRRRDMREEKEQSDTKDIRDSAAAAACPRISRDNGYKTDSDFTPSTSGTNTPAVVEQPHKHMPRIAAVPAFDPNDTMDLRALKEALNHKVDSFEPVPIASRGPPRPPKDPLAVYGMEDTRNSAANSMNTDGSLRAEPRNGRTSRRNSAIYDTAEKHSSGIGAVAIVDNPTSSSEDTNKPVVKSILRPPTKVFPEEANPTREGVAPLKDSKKDGVPPDARWTKISRSMVNPEALELGKERFEARDDCVIVLRVLSKDEVQGYAEVTQKLREKREEAEKRRRRRARHERHVRERRRLDDSDGARDSHRSYRVERTSHSESDTTEDEATAMESANSRARTKGVAFDKSMPRLSKESIE